MKANFIKLEFELHRFGKALARLIDLDNREDKEAQVPRVGSNAA